MNILFVNYWGLNEGLTQATTLPNLKILNEDNRVQKIIFTTIEREGIEVEPLTLLSKVTHIPLASGGSLLSKFSDFTMFPKRLIVLCIEHKIDKIIARGAPTGGIAWLVYRKTKIPFIVESYEPHAGYMLSAGTWSKNGIKYRIQKFLEKKQNQFAEGLITVSENYRVRLLYKEVKKSKLAIAPCPVDTKQFYIDNEKSKQIRLKLNCTSTTVVGVYVGKFGDIYYKEEVISIFEDAFRVFDDFRLVILTPQNDDFTNRLKIVFGDRLFLSKVNHSEVNDYLSASDFAFATIREHPIRAYCSPIKTGEYWACGLPVLISEGIGDDSQIIKDTGLGAVFSLKIPQSIVEGLEKIKRLIKKAEVSNQIIELAKTHRSIEHTKNAYERLVFKDKN